MKPVLTKKEMLELLKSTWQHWQKRPLRFPHFLVELEYIDFFSLLLYQLPSGNNDNIVPVVEHYLEAALEKSIRQICNLMDRQKPDSTAIWNLVSERQLILRRDQKIYKKQIPVKVRKELNKEYWMDYNHWTLATALWKGLIDSQNPEFRVIITSSVMEDSEDPVEVLLAHAYKPLWGMWAAFNALGRPLNSMENDSDSIHLRPIASLVRYSKETGKRLSFRDHIKSFSIHV